MGFVFVLNDIQISIIIIHPVQCYASLHFIFVFLEKWRLHLQWINGELNLNQLHFDLSSPSSAVDLIYECFVSLSLPLIGPLIPKETEKENSVIVINVKPEEIQIRNITPSSASCLLIFSLKVKKLSSTFKCN